MCRVRDCLHTVFASTLALAWHWHVSTLICQRCISNAIDFKKENYSYATRMPMLMPLQCEHSLTRLAKYMYTYKFHTFCRDFAMQSGIKSQFIQMLMQMQTQTLYQSTSIHIFRYIYRKSDPYLHLSTNTLVCYFLRLLLSVYGKNN